MRGDSRPHILFIGPTLNRSDSLKVIEELELSLKIKQNFKSMIETLSYIDWFSLTIIFIFAVMGFFNGFIKEVFSAAAWILSLSLAWLYGPIFFPYVEVYVDASTWVNIFSFIALFFVFHYFEVYRSGFSRLISVIGLKFVDRLFGTFFGSLKMWRY